MHLFLLSRGQSPTPDERTAFPPGPLVPARTPDREIEVRKI
jgi:hypothetical protein